MTLNSKKKLVTVKIYEEDFAELKKQKRSVPIGAREPSNAEQIHAAIQTLKKSAGGALPVPDDIKTPLERKVLAAILEYTKDRIDPIWRDAINKITHLAGLPLNELHRKRRGGT